MGNLIESLESRTHFSATVSADASQVAVDAAALRSAFQQYAPTAQADSLALRTAATAAHSHAGTALLARANAASNRDYSVVRADAFSMLAVEATAVRVVLADEARLEAKPTSTALKAKLLSDSIQQNARLTRSLNVLGSQGNSLGAAAGAALSALGAAFPNNAPLAAAISTIESDGSAFLSTAGVSIGAVQTDVIQMFTDAVDGN